MNHSTLYIFQEFEFYGTERDSLEVSKILGAKNERTVDSHIINLLVQ